MDLKSNSGMLYLVGTPIGNLKEITNYALEILNMVDYIACEDTRTSLTLLNAYNIKKPLISYHKFNEMGSTSKIIEDIRNGKNVAVISDAGMPGISDPGNILVNAMIKDNLPYTVISGPSALINAFILSGMSAPFTFVGFLPNKKSDAKKLLNEIKSYKTTIIFYVAPHDIKDTLLLIKSIFGDRKAVVVREISKKFEEVSHITLGGGYEGVLKGEFVLVVEGCNEEKHSDMPIIEEVDFLLSDGLSKNEAIKQVAHLRGITKNEVYQEYLKKGTK